jgi:hypothetical protein
MLNVVIESSFDPGERLQAPGSLWFITLWKLYCTKKYFIKIIFRGQPRTVNNINIKTPNHTVVNLWWNDLYLEWIFELARQFVYFFSFFTLGSVWLVTFSGIPLSHSALLLHLLFHVFMLKFLEKLCNNNAYHIVYCMYMEKTILSWKTNCRLTLT